MSNAVEEPTRQTVHDPVCHMDIVAADSAASIEHEGLTYYFCSQACKDRFESGPEGVLEEERSYEHPAQDQPVIE
ncbi:MAG TPA: YHS domain-containing protein [Dehalococcoidia bacterium]|jgi:Cu+-exporting ATPase|nr:YHS domain-containing protein [Dehalococcoidia bacterium]